jgi:hypothetical protein
MFGVGVGVLVGVIVTEPVGVGVLVGVIVGVFVGVIVGVLVGVIVGVLVGVIVTEPVGVGVLVGVIVGVLVGVIVGVLVGVIVGVIVEFEEIVIVLPMVVDNAFPMLPGTVTILAPWVSEKLSVGDPTVLAFTVRVPAKNVPDGGLEPDAPTATVAILLINTGSSTTVGNFEDAVKFVNSTADELDIMLIFAPDTFWAASLVIQISNGNESLIVADFVAGRSFMITPIPAAFCRIS